MWSLLDKRHWLRARRETSNDIRGLTSSRNSYRSSSLDDKNYPQILYKITQGQTSIRARATTRAWVHEVDVERDERVAQVVACVGGLASISYQINTISPSRSTTVYALMRATN